MEGKKIRVFREREKPLEIDLLCLLGRRGSWCSLPTHLTLLTHSTSLCRTTDEIIYSVKNHSEVKQLPDVSLILWDMEPWTVVKLYPFCFLSFQREKQIKECGEKKEKKNCSTAEQCLCKRKLWTKYIYCRYCQRAQEFANGNLQLWRMKLAQSEQIWEKWEKSVSWRAVAQGSGKTCTALQVTRAPRASVCARLNARANLSDTWWGAYKQEREWHLAWPDSDRKRGDGFTEKTGNLD